MRWTKFALLLAVPVLAIMLLGGGLRAPTTEAKPTEIVTINPVLCFMLTSTLDWDENGTPGEAVDSALGFVNCMINDVRDPPTFQKLIRVLGGDELDPKPSDLERIDREGGQLHELDGLLYIAVFVTNDEPVAFYADRGQLSGKGMVTPPAASIACGPAGPPDHDFVDEDCDDDGNKGDGVIVVKLVAAGADRGPASIRVRQGMLELEDEYTITGEPHDIEISTYETAIQTGAADCAMITGTAEFATVLAEAEKSVFGAVVTDDDDVSLTGAIVLLNVDDEDKARMAVPLSPSLDLGTLGAAAVNVLCGMDEPGTVTVTASIAQGIPGSIVTNPNARKKDAEAEYIVQGLPTDMVLTADPPSLVCDGINSSAVSAALTDADGNPAVNGTHVRFDAKALGVADPINATTADGAATTTVTPLSGIGKGVVVKATMMVPELDEETEEVVYVPGAAEESLLIECTESAPAAAEPAAPAPAAPGAAPAISPPATGDGGYLPAGQAGSGSSSAISWWLALPLGAGTLLLASGLALRRRAL